MGPLRGPIEELDLATMNPLNRHIHIGHPEPHVQSDNRRILVDPPPMPKTAHVVDLHRNICNIGGHNQAVDVVQPNIHVTNDRETRECEKNCRHKNLSNNAHPALETRHLVPQIILENQGTHSSLLDFET